MKRIFILNALVMTLAFWASSGVPAEKKQSISLECPPQAQVLKVDSYLKFLKEFGEGKPAMHVEVRVKNISQQAERFSIMVSTPDGDSAAAFLPEKAKKEGERAVLKPGEEGKVTLPMLVEKIADVFTVTVEVVPAE